MSNKTKQTLMFLDSLVEVIKDKIGQDLNNLQITILKGAYYDESYEQIAYKYGCSKDHAKRVGSDLWSLLSSHFGQSIDKRNVKFVLEQLKQELYDDTLELPVGVVPSNSRFYVERKEIESLCLRTIMRKGGLIRICAPSKMGKSSLMHRIINLAKDCRGVCLDLHLTDRETLTDLTRFLRWLSLNVTRELRLPSKLEEYWDDDLGCKSSCTYYFEDYLLGQIDRPLILAFDKLDHLFAREQIASDFLAMLRAWHENSKINPTWSQLRLILVYRDNPLPLESNKSPFNVGLTVSLPDFSGVEILDLARRHGLDWKEAEVTKLMGAIGGHPYLVRQALHQVKTQNLSLDNFLQQDFTKSTPYSNYLPVERLPISPSTQALENTVP
ncbi:AAA-like domain-containing protein [Mastigocoleus testarum]|uniref:vWA-MoxR associated protein N-terminal HTH domain-containing protein n=1 Tax=Mastigocoleus testarum BC008 TaxID=371196 RepID=A0A0V7ZNG6_9CYAN|nr:AAA-like domain-containing protein [Mastigocoleus testarum]KST65520.1 hypothetical protein BC008_42095 [Mastigocoleus testarum BC008]KST66092.1 hypothetical protein BC008_24260 [Mastigocoleus testarum BC008]